MRVFAGMRNWGPRHYAAILVAGTVWLLLSGVPTDILDTPLFIRMTPVVWWDYPFWIAGSFLVGLLAATYVPVAGIERPGGSQGKILGGGLLTAFAVGCPVCNKLVVLALGAGGALTYFAPLQPVLGLLSVGLLLYTLSRRLAGAEACRVGETQSLARR